MCGVVAAMASASVLLRLARALLVFALVLRLSPWPGARRATRHNNFWFRHLWLEKPAPCRSGRRELYLELTQICQSQPILAQLLRTLKSHPGVVVRFEGHVNSTCDLDCRGATGKPCKAARKVGSDMCARCPGGAYGLSKARA